MGSYDFSDGDINTVTRFPRGQSVIRGRQLSRQDAGAVIAMLDETVHKFVSAFGISERFPTQPPKGSVLMWLHKFNDDDDSKPYTYVALRAGNHWYVTGTQGNTKVTWEDLARRIGNSPCWLLTKYKEIPQLKSELDSINDPTVWADEMFGAPSDDRTEAQAPKES